MAFSVSANVTGEPARIQQRNGKTVFQSRSEAETFQAELRKSGFDRVDIIDAPGTNVQPGRITAPASKGDVQASARKIKQAQEFARKNALTQTEATVTRRIRGLPPPRTGFQPVATATDLDTGETFRLTPGFKLPDKRSDKPRKFELLDRGRVREVPNVTVENAQPNSLSPNFIRQPTREETPTVKPQNRLQPLKGTTPSTFDTRLQTPNATIEREDKDTFKGRSPLVETTFKPTPSGKIQAEPKKSLKDKFFGLGETSSKIDIQADKQKNVAVRVGAETAAFGIGALSIVPETVRTVSQPVQSIKSLVTAISKPGETGSAIGESFRQSPSSALGKTAGLIFGPKAVSKGVKTTQSLRKTDVVFDLVGNQQTGLFNVRGGSKLQGKDITGFSLVTDTSTGTGTSIFKVGGKRITVENVAGKTTTTIRKKKLFGKDFKTISKSESTQPKSDLSLDLTKRSRVNELVAIRQLPEESLSIAGSKEKITSIFEGSTKKPSRLRNIEEAGIINVQTNIGTLTRATDKTIIGKRENINPKSVESLSVDQIKPEFTFDKSKIPPDKFELSIKGGKRITNIERESKFTTKGERIDKVTGQFSYSNKFNQFGKRAGLNLGSDTLIKNQPTSIPIKQSRISRSPQINFNPSSQLSFFSKGKLRSGFRSNLGTDVNFGVASKGKTLSKQKSLTETDAILGSLLSSSSKVDLSTQVGLRSSLKTRVELSQKPLLSLKTFTSTTTKTGNPFTPPPPNVPTPPPPPPPFIPLFPKFGSSLIRTKKTRKKKKAEPNRKFRGTPSLSVVLGGVGKKLTKKQISGRSFINPFVARQL